jgi:hypothetical protein
MSQASQQHRIKLKDAHSWLMFNDAVADHLGDPARPGFESRLNYLAADTALETEYFSLSKAAEKAHIINDRALGVSLRRHLPFDQHRLLLQYGVQRKNPQPREPTDEEKSDGIVWPVYQADHDHKLKKWWCSPSHQAFCDLKARFDVLADDDSNDHLDRLVDLTLADARGNFNEFRTRYEELRIVWETAALEEDLDLPSNIETHLAAKLRKTFDVHDHATYGTACSELRGQKPPPTVDQVFNRLKREWNALNSRGGPNGASRPAPVKALVTSTDDAPPPSKWDQVISLLQQRQQPSQHSDSASGGGGSRRRERKTNQWWADATDEDKAKFKQARDAGICGKFFIKGSGDAPGQCQRGAKCPYAHSKTLPAPTVANVMHASDFVLMVTTVETATATAQPADELPAPPDSEEVESKTACHSEGESSMFDEDDDDYQDWQSATNARQRHRQRREEHGSHRKRGKRSRSPKRRRRRDRQRPKTHANAEALGLASTLDAYTYEVNSEARANKDAGDHPWNSLGDVRRVSAPRLPIPRRPAWRGPRVPVTVSRPSTGSRLPSSPDELELVMCPDCTFDNPPGALQCSMCHRILPRFSTRSATETDDEARHQARASEIRRARAASTRARQESPPCEHKHSDVDEDSDGNDDTLVLQTSRPLPASFQQSRPTNVTFDVTFGGRQSEPRTFAYIRDVRPEVEHGATHHSQAGCSTTTACSLAPPEQAPAVTFFANAAFRDEHRTFAYIQDTPSKSETTDKVKDLVDAPCHTPTGDTPPLEPADATDDREDIVAPHLERSAIFRSRVLPQLRRHGHTVFSHRRRAAARQRLRAAFKRSLDRRMHYILRGGAPRADTPTIDSRSTTRAALEIFFATHPLASSMSPRQIRRVRRASLVQNRTGSGSGPEWVLDSRLAHDLLVAENANRHPANRATLDHQLLQASERTILATTQAAAASVPTPGRARGGDDTGEPLTFVVDTGANAVVFGSTGVYSHLDSFTQSPGVVHSNGHRDEIVGQATLTASLEHDASGASSVFSLRGSVAPASVWNVAPPHLLPGFRSGTLDADGRIALTFANGETTTTTPYRGLQVIRFCRPSSTAAVPRSSSATVTISRASASSVTSPTLPGALKVSPPPPPVLMRLHEALGHAGVTTLHSLIRGGTIAIQDPATRTAALACTRLCCRHCALSRPPSQPRLPSGRGHSPSPPTQGTWSMDFFGPHTPSASGKTYSSVWVSFETDLFFVGLHPSKDDATQWFIRNRSALEAADGGRPIRRLLTDNGETSGAAFTKQCEILGIEKLYSSPGSSFQNGRAERAIRTLRGMTGASLSRSGLPAAFWAEALAHSVYIHNRLPGQTGVSPYERAWGSRPSLRGLHPFGCLVLSRAVQPRKSQWANRARPAAALSPATSTKDGHRILHLDTRAIAVSRNLAWFDSEFPYNSRSLASAPLGQAHGSGGPGNALEPQGEARLPLHARPGFATENPFSALSTPDDEATGDQEPSRRRSTRVSSRPADLYSPGAHEAQAAADREAAANVNVTSRQEEQIEPESVTGCGDIDEPRTLRSALASTHRDSWLAAVTSELNSHRVNGTWSPIDSKKGLPKGRSAIPSRWVFKVKRNADGTVDKFKARLVAKGFRQRPFVDYHETFSPTLRLTTLRLLLATAVQLDYVAHQLDVTTAFLVPTLQEEIYMVLPEQPLINENLPSFKTEAIVRLHKTLYGLVQAPAMFFKHFSVVLNKIGFNQSKHDPCLWLKHSADNLKLEAAIAIWVDDCCVVAAPNLVDVIKRQLKDHFRMTDGGPINWFLGVRFKQDLNARTITLDQSPSIKALLKKYHLESARSCATPIEARLTKGGAEPSEEDQAFMRDKNYRAIVGSIMYLQLTRPDIAFAVNQLTRHLNDARPAHWRAAIRVLRYLSGTVNISLCYDGNDSNYVQGFSDADWAGETETRRSTSGFTFIFAGGVISSRTKLQTTVALSTCESELNALIEAVREAAWIRFLTQELRISGSEGPMTIHEDNQAALLIAENHRFSDRIKHVAIRYFFIRDEIANGSVSVIYCPTDRMAADIFTKPLTRVIFERLRLLLGLRAPESNLQPPSRK